MNCTRVHPRNIRRSVIASAIACCFAPGLVLANPVGANVSHGHASFNTLGKTLTVTNSPGAIINWQGFSIAAGETTRFVQQNAASAILNRVVGKDASAIFGALQSNGRVFLINPNGILFGAGAQIDTAGLVASTLNMLDSDFIMGKMRFGQTPGAGPLSNAGEIRTPIGGRVLLIASESVENSGIIHSPKGEVILAAGNSVELADSANPEVRVEISAPGSRAVNLGKIVSESGRVGIYGGLVANRGIVSADSAQVDENGKIVFKATKDARLDAGKASGSSAVLSDNGRIVVKTAGEASSEAGSARAVLSDNGRIVFTTTPESSPEAESARAIVHDNGRIVFLFEEAAHKRSPEAASLTSPVGESTVAGESGRVVFMATTEASLGAGSTTSANGPTGGSIEVSSGNGTTLVAGSVQATGSEGSGGEVRLLGERVGLIGAGSIDVSGERDGGTALVGGDLQGANASVRNAQMTYFGGDASIKADAGTSGDGGKVIVWADDSTRSYGHISARGGRTGGDGGFVETSGKLRMDVRRGPDLRAPAGKSGTWLLDPNDLTVVAGAGLDPLLNTGAPFFAPLEDSSTIGVALINAQLDFGSNVVLNTTSRGASDGTQAGNITILAPIVKQAETTSGGVFIGTTSLLLQAHNDIVIGAGGSISSSGDPLNVSLQANFDGAGGGGVSIGGAIVTNGGSFIASGADLIALNAPINTMRSGSGGSVQFNSSSNGVILAAPITGGFVSANAQGGTLAASSSITSTSSVSFAGRDGVSIAGSSSVTTGPFSSFSATVTGTSSSAALDIGAGAAISSRGATLTADNMNIQGVVNAADGSITVRQTNFGRAINIGTETSSALSLTQPELDNLLTTGTFSLGNTNTGAITVNGTVSGPSPSFVFVTSGTSYAQNAGVSLTGGLSINAPAITIAAPLSAGASGISLTTDTLTLSVGGSVASGGNLDVNARSFGRQISLGVSSPVGIALEMTDAQIDLLSTPTRLRFSTSGLIDIAGPVSPAGATTLSLASSNNSVTQQSLATIQVPSLAVSARTMIDLPEHNQVSNFAAQIQCCSAGDINFVAAAGKAVTIGTVDGLSGVTVNNFSGTGNIMLQADALEITQPVRTNVGNVNLLPESTTTTVTLGGEVGGTLSLTAAELALVQGTQVTISSNEIDIAGPVTFFAPTTILGPITTDRPVKIVAAKVDPAANEFTPGELANITGGTVVLGGVNAGPVSVETTTAIPNTISKLVLHSGGASSSVTVGLSTPLTATNSIGITADSVNIQSGVSSSNGNIEIATHTPTRKIDLGLDPGSSLGLSAAEIAFLSAPAGTVSFTTTSGDIDVTGGVSFPSVAGLALDAGGTFHLLTAGSLSSGGALSVRAPTIDIQGTTSMAAGGSGDLTLVGNTVSIVAAGTTVTAPGNINVRPRDSRSIDLGGAGPGGSLSLDNSELSVLSPTGILRIGDTGGFTRDIALSAAISLPGRTLSLKTGDGRITQGALATLTAAALAAEASDDITLNAANQVGSVALRSWFDSITFVRGPGGALALNTVDDLSGVHAGIFSFTPQPVTLTADQIDINQSLIGSNISLLPTAGLSIDIGARSGFGFAQADFDRISATSVSIGNSLADDLTVSAPIAVSTFSNLALVTGNAAAVNAAVTVPGDLSITSSSMTVSGALTSTAGNVALVTDSLSVGNTVSAFNAITVRPPLTSTVQVDLGTDTVGKLALTDAEIDKLSAPTLIFGPTPRIDITAAVTPAPAVQTIQLITDDLTVSGSLTVPNLSVSTVTSGRTIDLGTSGVGTFMGLDAATLGLLTTSDSLSFAAPGSSTITVSSALTIPSDLSLSARTLNINEFLTANGDIALRADVPLNIAAGKSVTSSGGGDILVAPRSGGMTFGAGGLLDSAKVGQLVTTGFLELGDSDTSSINIAQPLNASAFGGVMLTASGDIGQTSGSIITAGKLGVQTSFGTVTLTEANAVGTLAGSAGSFSGFSFVNAGPLTIGTVDSLTGVSSGGLVTLRADSLNIVDPIFGSTVTLAPRLAGTAIDLGTDTGFGLTDAELDRVSAFTLNIGEGGASGSGPITVSAAIDHVANLNLLTAPGSSIAVNAALGSSTSGAISLNAGAGGSVNIAGPVGSESNISVVADSISTSSPVVSEFGSILLNNVGTSGSVTIGGGVHAFNSISVTGKTIAVNAPMQADFGSVNLTAPTGASGSSAAINGSVKAGSSINITTDSLAINAPLESGFSVTLQPRSSGTDVSVGLETPGAFSITASELGFIDADQLSLGSSSAGDLVVNAPIGPFDFSTLVLRSGGDVTQTAGSTITVRTGDPSDPSSISGALSVFSGGRIDLPEANDVAVSVSGTASGTSNDFVFNNVSPLRLQNVSGVFASGKVLVRTATPTPTASGDGSGPLANALLNDINKAAEPGDNLKKSAEDRKDEADKREREEQKKRGTQSCS